jgi:hypothetical protein
VQWLLSSGVTLGGLLGAVFLAVLSGALVSKKTADAQIKQAQSNAALWQKAAEASATRADVAMEQTRQLLTSMATVESLLRALSPPPPQRREQR